MGDAACLWGGIGSDFWNTQGAPSLLHTPQPHRLQEAPAELWLEPKSRALCLSSKCPFSKACRFSGPLPGEFLNVSVPCVVRVECYSQEDPTRWSGGHWDRVPGGHPLVPWSCGPGPRSPWGSPLVPSEHCDRVRPGPWHFPLLRILIKCFLWFFSERNFSGISWTIRRVPV